MSAEKQEPLIRTRGLGKEFVQRRSFTGAKFKVEALRDVNLEIPRGATLAIIGESGGGKSTLARCLALLENPTKGEIFFDGVIASRLSRAARRSFCRRVQLVFQNPASAMNPGMTALEIISEPLVIQREGDEAARRRKALELMEQVGLSTDAAIKLPREFSGGQRQRLAIARALALGPEMLIFDEALSNLDLTSQELLLRLLDELQSALGLTYLHISHDLSLVAECADEIAVMRAGAIVECKPAAQLLGNPKSIAGLELPYEAPDLELAQASGPRRAR